MQVFGSVAAVVLPFASYYESDKGRDKGKKLKKSKKSEKIQEKTTKMESNRE
jgi:hypothetical protein